MTDAVAVISHERVAMANKKTLRLLAERNVDRGLVHVFVADDQLAAYAAGLDRALYGELHVGGLGVPAQRNAVYDFFPEGAEVASLDDDISEVGFRLDEKHVEPIADLNEVFDRGFAACRMAGATLWAIYPVYNALFMKPGTTTDLRFCMGHLWGFVNRRAEWARTTLRCKEDYERTLVRYEHDGVVVRLNDVAARTKLGAGGVSPARQAANRQAVLELRRRWPDWVRVTKRRSALGLEIAVADKARRP